MHVMANEMRMDVRQQHDAAMYLKLTSRALSMIGHWPILCDIKDVTKQLGFIQTFFPPSSLILFVIEFLS